MFSQACVISSVQGEVESWLPSMHHRSHDQGVCIRGGCIGGSASMGDLHPGRGSDFKGSASRGVG